MKKPLLSIITVCKDNVSELYITLASVLDSIPTSMIEVVVISSSTDENYHRELTLFSDINQIKVYRSPPLGVYHAMNYGLTLYNGSWVWFLNSGDLCSISDSEFFINILSKERDAKCNALLFFGSVRSTFTIYPTVKRPFLHGIIDKDKWFKLFPCMHPCILVSSTCLTTSSFKYSISKPINADQEYINYFQNLPLTSSYHLFISEFTLGGISTKGFLGSFVNILFRKTSPLISFIDEGLILLRLVVLDFFRSLFCIMS